MQVKYRESFTKDLKQIKNKRVKKQIEKTIKFVKSASAMSEIPNVKKLRGYKNFYRIGNYRIRV